MGIQFNAALQSFGEAVTIGGTVGFNAIASGALAYLSGFHGWNGEKVEGKVVKTRILATIKEDGERQKSTAYKWANSAFRLAQVLNKDHKEFLAELATFDGETAEAVQLTIAYAKASYGVTTLGAFEEALFGGKSEKPAKPVGELVAAVLKKADGREWSADDHKAVAAAAVAFMSTADITALANALQASVAQANAARAAAEAQAEARNAAIAAAKAAVAAAA